ncbi:MAG TPA: transglycosylase domain-containing protein [Candidatus Limnocylindrales bacterium]
MQTSLARRQRHRRTGPARQPRGGSAARRVAIALPVIFFSFLLVMGLLVLVGAVAAYSYYSRGLQDPRVLLTNIAFDQQTILYDRTGKIELARLGELRRELVTYDQLPPDLLDATTAIEDKDFWQNPGFDLPGFIAASVDTLNGRPRGGSTITQQLVRAKLLPDEAFADTVYERKIREIIQSIRLTQEYQGVEGKQQIITAYLNQNFYGDRSYGVKAAASTYFAKPLDKLSLAQAAILAGIPQSPTKFDLSANAVPTCDVVVKDGADCPTAKLHLIVPDGSEIVIRRNYILDRMRQWAVLTHHSAAEYEAAKSEPVEIVSQAGTPWKAPQFVWQTRQQLARILCPGETLEKCAQVDTGGYRVTTTLDYKMQRTVERWIYAATRGANASDPRATLRALKIPTADWGWILGLRGHNLNNGASAVIDYRTGQVLAYSGSASYTAKGNRKFQPQFDVLSDGWRQPGSSIKPVNYLIGIDDKTMTAATMFMDVVTDFGGHFTPKQADGLERGPVRLRSALQFSLNIPAIKAGIMNGLKHFYARTKEMGLSYPSGANPVVSMGIGTLESHPIDLLGAYGAIADGGVLMPRTMIVKVVDSKGTQVWPVPGAAAPKGKQVASAQAAYIITDILSGNTDTRVNPFWGKWAITDGARRRPAAYKTGTTSDNRDVHAYGFLPAPADKKAPALAVGVWMGNSDNSPNDGKLSLDTSAPVWSAILSEISHGMPISSFAASRPGGIVNATVDAFTGQLPGPFTTRTVDELFIPGTVPRSTDNLHVVLDIDSATGLLWQDGCTGPMVTRGFIDFRRAEPNFPTWAKYNRGWAARAAHGQYVRGGPEGTRTVYFYNGAFRPFGASWGGQLPPTEICAPLPVVTPPVCDPLLGLPCPSPGPGGGPTPSPTPFPTPTPRPKPTPKH